MAPRAFTEDLASDSLENVLFSITRFHELTGKVPRKLTVVGYEFKRDRFVDPHRRLLGSQETGLFTSAQARRGPKRGARRAKSRLARNLRRIRTGAPGSWVGNDGSGTPST